MRPKAGPVEPEFWFYNQAICIPLLLPSDSRAESPQDGSVTQTLQKLHTLLKLRAFNRLPEGILLSMMQVSFHLWCSLVQLLEGLIWGSVQGGERNIFGYFWLQSSYSNYWIWAHGFTKWNLEDSLQIINVVVLEAMEGISRVPSTLHTFLTTELRGKGSTVSGLCIFKKQQSSYAQRAKCLHSQV